MSFVIEPYVIKVTTSSAQIVWVMAEGTPAGKVQIEKQAGGGFQEIDAEVTTPEFVNSSGTDNVLSHVRQVAYINSLEPYTRYEYTVEPGDGESTQSGSFNTMREASDNGPQSFVIGGDSHNGGGGGNLSYTLTAPYIAAHDPDFYVHLGDWTGGSGEFSRWPGYFTAAEPYLSKTSLIDVKGNHDIGSTSRNYESLFTHNDPQGPPVTGNNPVYYTMRSGNVEIFVVDDNLDMSNQFDWLNQVIPASDAKWKILVVHGALRNQVGGSGTFFEGEQALGLVEICLNHGIDIAVQAHYHVVERTYPIGSPGVKPVHFYLINPASKRRATRPSPVSVSHGTSWSFLYIEVDGDTMVITHRTRGIDNWDALTLNKDSNGLYQQEIMDQAIELDTAIQIAHVYTGNSFVTPLTIRKERKDILCKIAEIPVEGEPVVIEFDTGARREGGGWPIGSKLIIEEQTDPTKWQSAYQEIEVTGETTQAVITAPSSFSYSEEEGFDPPLELQVNFELPEEE